MKIDKTDFTNSAGIKLSAVITYPEEGEKFPCLIIAHGFTSAKDRAPAKKFSQELAEAGFASFRFDFTAHGESEGAFEEINVTQQVDDLKCAYKFVRNFEQIDSENISIFGTSLGGMTAILAAPDLKIKTLHLRAPVSDFGNTWKDRVPAEVVKKWEEQGHIHEGDLFFSDAKPSFLGKKLNYSFYEDGIKQDCYAASEHIKVPTLILHGDADKAVPLAQSEELMKHLNVQKKLEIFEGQGHNFDDLTQEKMRKLCIDWLNHNK